MEKRDTWKLHRDDEVADELRVVGIDKPVLRLVTIPRYKTSELSGDEWRTSANMEINMGNSKIFDWVVLDSYAKNLKYASIMMFPKIYTDHHDLMELDTSVVELWRKGRKIFETSYAGQPKPMWVTLGHVPDIWSSRPQIGIVETVWSDWYTYCFQPSCPEKAISVYQLKVEYNRKGHEYISEIFNYRRAFCKKHLRRGDCGLEDADINYLIIEGIGEEAAEGFESDISKSTFGGVIDYDE